MALQRGDEYGYSGNADVYVYIWLTDRSYSDLETGQVIADFVVAIKKAPVQTSEI